MTQNQIEGATVYVVEDNPTEMESVKALVESLGYDFQGFSCPEDFQELPTRSRPGCLVLDHYLGEQSGLDLFEIISKRHDALPTVVVTGHASVPVAVAFMKSGALTLMQKPCFPDELAAAIQMAVASDAATLQRRQQLESVRMRLAELTPRQECVLERMLSGMPNKRIATSLRVSQRTVELERAKLLKNFGVQTSVQLASKVAEYRTEAKHLAAQQQTPAVASLV
ncbi:MAG: response regulator [Planctomycetota bacterium]